MILNDIIIISNRHSAPWGVYRKILPCKEYFLAHSLGRIFPWGEFTLYTPLNEYCPKGNFIDTLQGDLS